MEIKIPIYRDDGTAQPGKYGVEQNWTFACQGEVAG